MTRIWRMFADRILTNMALQSASTYCSFCGKSHSTIGPLAEGPDSVYICYPCVTKCKDLLEAQYHRRQIPFPESPRAVDDRTRSQINQMAAEVQEMSSSEIDPQAFYSGFLERIVASLAAIGGAIWMRTHEDKLQLIYHCKIENIGLSLRELEQPSHIEMLGTVFRNGRGSLIQPHSKIAEQLESGNPTGHLVVTCILETVCEKFGLVEIFQRVDVTPAAQRGNLEFVRQMCEHANQYQLRKEKAN